MKRFIFFYALAVALCVSGLAYAQQHPHGASGAIGAPVTHGQSGQHDNSGKSASGNSAETAPKTASSQLSSNNHLNTALTKALGPLVPSGGLVAACTRYASVGRCISAIHVADNRKIDFFCLRRAMTGEPLPMGDTTPCSATQTNLKLGKAIQTLDPNADPNVEAAKGIKQANADINTAKS